jgi:hypothetical protein
MGLSEIIHLVFARVDAARSHRVQEGLPEMAPRTLHESDSSAPTEAIAQPGDELEPGGSAAHDYDAVCILVSLRCHALLICTRCILNSLAVHCVRHLLHSECTRAHEQFFAARVASMETAP